MKCKIILQGVGSTYWTINVTCNSFIETTTVGTIQFQTHARYFLPHYSCWSSAALLLFIDKFGTAMVLYEYNEYNLFKGRDTGSDLQPWQGRIQEFTLGGGANQDPQSKVKGEARIEGAMRPSIDLGRSPSWGCKAPENWGRSPNRGRSPSKAGGGVWGGGSVSPLPRNFLKNQTWNHSFWCLFEAIIWND